MDSKYSAVSKYTLLPLHLLTEALAQISYLVPSGEAFYFDAKTFTSYRFLDLRNGRCKCQLIAHSRIVFHSAMRRTADCLKFC